MIDHVSLGTNSFDRAVVFYQTVLAPLGVELVRNTGAEAAFGTPSQWSFFLYPIAQGTLVTAAGTHLALSAASREQVASVYSAALKAQALDIFPPRLRPDISATYFGAMFSDLDGHRIEVVTNAI